MKLIRELRWGPHKSFKTGAVVGTYPKPMLVLQFDADGVSVIPSSKQPRDPSLIQLNCTYEDVKFCKPGELGQWVTKPESEQPKVLVVDYTTLRPKSLTLDYMPLQSQEGLIKFQQPGTGDFNQIAGKTSLPWKTIVFDGATGYMETVLSHFSSMNPNRMADARDWAFRVGLMLKNVYLSITLCPCHVVCLMHDELDKNELSQQVLTIPYTYGKELRSISGALFSQYFHAQKNMQGKPVVLQSDQMFVKGVGARWPVLSGETQPDFNSIYGKELL